MYIQIYFTKLGQETNASNCMWHQNSDRNLHMLSLLGNISVKLLIWDKTNVTSKANKLL